MKTKVLVVDRVYKRSQGDFNSAEDLEFIPVARGEAEIVEAITKEQASIVVPATDKYSGGL